MFGYFWRLDSCPWKVSHSYEIEIFLHESFLK